MTLTKSKSDSETVLRWAFNWHVSSRWCGLCERLRRSSDFDWGEPSSDGISISPTSNINTALINSQSDHADHVIGTEWLIELIDWVKVLRPTRHKMGHFGDIPKADRFVWYGKKLKLTQQKCAFTNQKKCTPTQSKHKKLMPGLVASYDIWPGNREGLFLFRHFINLSVTHLLRHLSLPYSPGTHTGPLIEWFKLWCSTQHKIGHLGDVFVANLLA